MIFQGGSRHALATFIYTVDDGLNHERRYRKIRKYSFAGFLHHRCVRTLESWARSGQTEGDTQIFITPGFAFQVVDALVTNFHLPKSTLMMLVSALAGHGHVMALYRHAIHQRYRFFSYGDAMLLSRTSHAAV